MRQNLAILGYTFCLPPLFGTKLVKPNPSSTQQTMYIILGATGHVGSAVAETLLTQGEQVTVITRDKSKLEEWKQKEAEVAVADVHNVDELRQIFRGGQRLFLLNPPALPSTDTVAEERKSMHSIISALEGSGIEKIVAESTYGAQAGNGIGDLGVLYEMEQKLAETSIPATIIRAAYYMSNWDAYLQTIEKENKIYTLYPSDFKLPMVAPEDIGRFAAKLLRESVEKTGLYYVEGPIHYSANDVAGAFSEALDREVRAEVVERNEWVPFLTGVGFSEKAAEAMAAMTEITLNAKYEVSNFPVRGETSIREHVQKLIEATA
jgi:uncharacterized protein YbjT (DUF2867 family)